MVEERDEHGGTILYTPLCFRRIPYDTKQIEKNRIHMFNILNQTNKIQHKKQQKKKKKTKITFSTPSSSPPPDDSLPEIESNYSYSSDSDSGSDAEFGEYVTVSSLYARKKINRSNAWKDIRPSLFKNIISSTGAPGICGGVNGLVCNKDAVWKCIECKQSKLLALDISELFNIALKHSFQSNHFF